MEKAKVVLHSVWKVFKNVAFFKIWEHFLSPTLKLTAVFLETNTKIS